MAIIAGYAGVGKTWFANKIEDAIEILSMPYSWILHNGLDMTEKELEKEKGALYHIANPLFPMNMVLDILKAESMHTYVIIPTMENVLKVLRESYDKECVLVYPEENLKEEYSQRYLNRGNRESFMSLFVDGWTERLEYIRANKGVHIPLATGEYLLDVKSKIDNIIARETNVPKSIIERIETELSERRKGLVLVCIGMKNEYAYRISDMDDDDTKKFLYKVGRLSYELNIYKPRIFNESEIRMKYVLWVESQEDFIEVIRQNG